MTFELKEFNIGGCRPRGAVFILGGLYSGKTTLIHKLIGSDQSLVYSNDHEYVNKVPDQFIFHDIDQFPETINLIKERAVLANQKNIELLYTNLVIDDLIEEPEPDNILQKDRWENQPIVKDILMRGRHYKTRLIVASRYFLLTKPDLRANLGYFFLFSDSIYANPSHCRLAFQYYFRNYIDKNTFNAIMRSLNGHQALVLDNFSQQIFYY